MDVLVTQTQKQAQWHHWDSCPNRKELEALWPILITAERILKDATGDIDEPKKRIWPIRAKHYRELKKAIEKWRKT